MGGRLQIGAGAVMAASAIGVCARADERNGLYARVNPARGSWTSIELGLAGLRTPAEQALDAAERNTSAGTTMKRSGWRASLIVNSFGPRQTVDGDPPFSKSYSFGNARLTGQLAKN